MDLTDVLLWGVAATLVLTSIMAAGRPLGFSRMDLPFLLGTLFTANRNKAPLYGFALHLVIGWLFAGLYSTAFRSVGITTWWFGLAIGCAHGVFVLSSGLQLLCALHPRVAQPYQGPTPTRQLEPPGFFALHYGSGTPLVILFAHVLYGGLLGFVYQ